MKALIAGPCVSEFGWEIMEWQGYVRRQALGCDLVIVCSRPHTEYLYADIAGLQFIPHDIEANVTTHQIDELITPERLDVYTALLNSWEERLRNEGYEVARLVIPKSGMRFAERFMRSSRQSYIRLGRAQPDILVHMRAKRYLKGGEPNYPARLWKQVLARLKVRGHRNIAAIGTISDALCLSPCVDMRDIPMERLCDLMRNAKVIIGPSSGPMHLASLCECPQVTWTQRQATADRYHDGWNPFRVSVHTFIQRNGSWITPEQIVHATMDMLKKPVRLSDQRNGICYVAVGEDFHGYLSVSLRSLRMFYDGDVSILTDRESKVLSELSVKYRASVITITPPKELSDHGRSRWIKTQVYQYSPYDVTAYLDVDTVICNPIDGIFSLITEDQPMAVKTETGCEQLRDRGWGQQTVEERNHTLDLCGSEYPHWHTSTMVFRRDERVAQLFRRWHREWLRYGMERPAHPVQDQPAFARAACGMGMAFLPLPKRFNGRARRDGHGDCLSMDTVVYSVRPYNRDFHRMFPYVCKHVASQHGIPIECLQHDYEYRNAPRTVMRRRGDT